jgi:hypothetical protein
LRWFSDRGHSYREILRQQWIRKGKQAVALPSLFLQAIVQQTIRIEPSLSWMYFQSPALLSEVF